MSLSFEAVAGFLDGPDPLAGPLPDGPRSSCPVHRRPAATASRHPGRRPAGGGPRPALPRRRWRGSTRPHRAGDLRRPPQRGGELPRRQGRSRRRRRPGDRTPGSGRGGRSRCGRRRGPGRRRARAGVDPGQRLQDRRRSWRSPHGGPTLTADPAEVARILEPPVARLPAGAPRSRSSSGRSATGRSATAATGSTACTSGARRPASSASWGRCSTTGSEARLRD